MKKLKMAESRRTKHQKQLALISLSVVLLFFAQFVVFLVADRTMHSLIVYFGAAWWVYVLGEELEKLEACRNEDAIAILRDGEVDNWLFKDPHPIL